MTNRKRAETIRQLKNHLEQYRIYRWRATLVAVRKQELADDVKQELGFHAIQLAECLDILGGSTR